jgi:hypothetical protein
MCEDCGLIEFKVPLVRPSTEGVPAHREGRYSLWLHAWLLGLRRSEEYVTLGFTVSNPAMR